jgi:hypothetical protein
MKAKRDQVNQENSRNEENFTENVVNTSNLRN